MRKLSNTILLAAGFLVTPLFSNASINVDYDQPFPNGFYSNGKAVQAVLIQTKRERFAQVGNPSRDRFDRAGMLYHSPNHRIDAIALQERYAFRTVFDFFRFVPGVWVNGRFNGEQVQIRGGSNVLYLLDGMRVDAGALRSIDPWNVDFIDVLKGPKASIYGGLASNGVIAVYTRMGPVEPRNQGFRTPHLIRPAFTTVDAIGAPVLPEVGALADASDYYGELVLRALSK